MIILSAGTPVTHVQVGELYWLRHESGEYYLGKCVQILSGLISFDLLDYAPGAARPQICVRAGVDEFIVDVIHIERPAAG